MSETTQCAACGHIWLKADSAACPNEQCPVSAQARWEAAVACAVELTAGLDADDGTMPDWFPALKAALRSPVIVSDMGVAAWSSSTAKVTAEQAELWEEYEAAERRWHARKLAVAECRAAEQRAVVRSRLRRVSVDGIDITELIALVWDVAVGRDDLDLDDGILDTTDIENLMLVADLVGFDPPTPDLGSAPAALLEGAGVARRDILTSAKREEIRKAWAAQVHAKAQALRDEHRSDGQENDRRQRIPFVFTSLEIAAAGMEAIHAYNRLNPAEVLVLNRLLESPCWVGDIDALLDSHGVAHDLGLLASMERDGLIVGPVHGVHAVVPGGESR